MDTSITYNIKFRKELPDDLFAVFKNNGFVTGSSLVCSEWHDVDLVVYCNSEVIIATNYEFKALNMHDAAQFVFEYLLEEGYSIYVGGNYRDSTFLSCYVHYKDTLYNLLLMDEENVVSEWMYATDKMLSNLDMVASFSKYDRVKFFEKARKEFRRTLTAPF